MPIRKTNQGWYWGNKGPFPTKQKAIDVGRAAHAAGYKEAVQMERDDAINFASVMLHSITCAHMLHLKSRSYAAHIALGEYYEGIDDLIDLWIEAYQGKYGLIDKYENQFEDHDNALEYMLMLNDYIVDKRYRLPEDSELQNIVDEMVALIDRTIYKLTTFR